MKNEIAFSINYQRSIPYLFLLLYAEFNKYIPIKLNKLKNRNEKINEAWT